MRFECGSNGLLEVGMVHDVINRKMTIWAEDGRGRGRCERSSKPRVHAGDERHCRRCQMSLPEDGMDHDVINEKMTIGLKTAEEEDAARGAAGPEFILAMKGTVGARWASLKMGWFLMSSTERWLFEIKTPEGEDTARRAGPDLKWRWKALYKVPDEPPWRRDGSW
jgi:hypothetical protein